MDSTVDKIKTALDEYTVNRMQYKTLVDTAVQDSRKRNITTTDMAALEVGNSTSLIDKAGRIMDEIVKHAEDLSGQRTSI